VSEGKQNAPFFSWGCWTTWVHIGGHLLQGDSRPAASSCSSLRRERKETFIKRPQMIKMLIGFATNMYQRNRPLLQPAPWRSTKNQGYWTKFKQRLSLLRVADSLILGNTPKLHDAIQHFKKGWRPPGQKSCNPWLLWDSISREPRNEPLLSLWVSKQ
jgi:hypothetical protein